MIDESMGRPAPFQSAPPHGGRPTEHSHPGIVFTVFNPRPRTGGDRVGSRGGTHVCVSIRAPARGATSSAPPDDKIQFQSAPPHGGRRPAATPIDQLCPVSIRAPARGATRLICGARAVEYVSIRAPARGATGGDVTREVLICRVSIRAPARGATRRGSQSPSDPRCFNPRPRTGGDPSGVAPFPVTSTFQSAPPHGGRPGAAGRYCAHCLFQSAPPHGGRHRSIGYDLSDDGFNPRPRTGGDTADEVKAPSRSFNPRPRTGGDRVRWRLTWCAGRFNPRPRTGGDSKYCASQA